MNASTRPPRGGDDLSPHVLQLYRFALARLRDRDAAEEVVQETLLAALEHHASFAGRSSVRTWLTAILKHKIVDLKRAQARAAGSEAGVLEQTHGDGNGGMAQLAARPNAWNDPVRALEQKRMLRTFDQAVADLPECAARVFEMRELRGLNTGEVSAALGISSNNCCVILHRARSALRENLRRRGFEP
jgi:RNA polymerase sigma-70 factor (ECF subfamily)